MSKLVVDLTIAFRSLVQHRRRTPVPRRSPSPP